MIFLLSKNKQIHPQMNLEDTWMNHLQNNERQKYKDAMKLCKFLVIGEDQKRFLCTGHISMEQQEKLLTLCEKIEQKVFNVTELLEKECCGRTQKVSTSATPTYMANGSRLGVVKKMLTGKRTVF